MGLLSSAKYAILTNLPGGITNVIIYDRFGNEIANQAGDTAQDLYNDALAERIDQSKFNKLVSKSNNQILVCPSFLSARRTWPRSPSTREA